MPFAVPGQEDVHYADNGGVSLAYQVFGEGELDLLLVTGWVLPMEHAWEEPGCARFLERLASFARVIVWDKRGTGLSDRMPAGRLPTLEDRVEDLTAVMDAAGCERAAILGISEGVPMSSLFAAVHPDRTQSLVLYGGWARALAAPDYPWGADPDRFGAFIEYIRRSWADPADLLSRWAPSAADDPRLRAWWTRALRHGASPGAAADWLALTADMDIREVLPAIDAPTLVLHKRDDRIVGPEHGRYLAEHIPGARYVELPGADHLWWIGDDGEMVDEIERFLLGAPAFHEPERVLTTVLLTDIVGSTRRAAAMGDRAWHDLLTAHDDMVRRELARFGGREIKTLGDGFLATFEGPTRAIRCAQAIRTAARSLGLDVRAGVHTGECERHGDDDITGVAVNTGARIGALAGAGEVLVSRTVRDLVAGSGLAFEQRGTHRLQGLDGEWELLAVA